MSLLPYRLLPRSFCQISLAIAALVACWPAAADMSESLEYRYYTVEPSWYQSLAGAVLKASPVRENGKTFMGNTLWTVKWDMEWRSRANGQCAMEKVRTHLHSVITLPQAVLKDAEDAQRFDAFLAALRAHEQEHVDIARDAARAIDERLQRMPAMASCDQLEDAANALGQTLLEEARQRGVDFDRKTGHGKTQGAVLN